MFLDDTYEVEHQLVLVFRDGEWVVVDETTAQEPNKEEDKEDDHI